VPPHHTPLVAIIVPIVAGVLLIIALFTVWRLRVVSRRKKQKQLEETAVIGEDDKSPSEGEYFTPEADGKAIPGVELHGSVPGDQHFQELPSDSGTGQRAELLGSEVPVYEMDGGSITHLSTKELDAVHSVNPPIKIQRKPLNQNTHTDAEG